MSKFIEYKTEYYDKEQAAAAFPEIQSPKPGYYVSFLPVYVFDEQSKYIIDYQPYHTAYKCTKSYF